MALKDTWIDKRDTTDGTDGDYIVASDINQIARAVIDLEDASDKGKSYTKDEVNKILEGYAKKEQTFDGIIRLEYNDGIIDTYELDNTTTAGTYRVVIDSTNDILGDTDREQYILLVGISSRGEEITYTQTRISNNGMMETRSRSNLDEEWSEWVNKMLGDMDKALDELHNYAQSLIGGEA